MPMALVEADDVAAQALAGAVAEVKRDVNEIFLEMYTAARAIAASRSAKSGPLAISRGDWTQAKWRTIEKWSLHPRREWWRIVARWLELAAALPVGYGFSDPASLWGWIVGGSLVGVIAFAVHERG